MTYYEDDDWFDRHQGCFMVCFMIAMAFVILFALLIPGKGPTQ